jgi:hypothetical protein
MKSVESGNRVISAQARTICSFTRESVMQKLRNFWTVVKNLKAVWIAVFIATMHAIFWGVFYLGNGYVPMSKTGMLVRSYGGVRYDLILSRFWDVPVLFATTFIVVGFGRYIFSGSRNSLGKSCSWRAGDIMSVWLWSTFVVLGLGTLTAGLPWGLVIFAPYALLCMMGMGILCGYDLFWRHWLKKMPWHKILFQETRPNGAL